MSDSKLKVFLDANIFIAGSASSSGGSAFVLHACRKGIVQGITTKLILQEAKRNISDKLGEKVLSKFYKIIKTLSLTIQPPPSTELHYRNIIEFKDAHVLAASIESKSNYLITLDRRHFFTKRIQQANLPIKIVTPKRFIQQL